MCEYCGCQDIEAIALLTREHDEIREIARNAVTAADNGTAVDAVRRLIAALAPHTEVEERGLFPAMREAFPDHTAALSGEHREIEGLLHAFLADPTGRRTLHRAVDALFEHILREQDGLFPAALSHLTPADWDHLDAVRAGVTAVVSH